MAAGERDRNSEAALQVQVERGAPSTKSDRNEVLHEAEEKFKQAEMKEDI